MKTIFVNKENSKMSEPRKVFLNLLQRLDLKSSDEHVAFRSLSIYYTQENIRKQYKNNKLKIIAPTWNDEFEFQDGSYSVSDLQDYTECIIKEHETLTAILPIHVYISRIDNRLVFQIIKDGYKPETIKLFGSTKN